MAGVQVNRTLTNVYLPSAVSNEIWQTVQESSVITRAARRITLPGEGVTIPIITGDAVADWVAETGEKPVSRPTIGSQTITGYKLALIVPFSNEFRRDLPTLYSALASRLPAAIGKKFDETIFGYDSSPGSGFDTLSGIAEVELVDYSSIVEAAQTVADVDDAAISHTILSPQADFIFSASVDSEGRPLWPDTDAVFGKFGGSVLRSKHVYDAGTGTVGVVGDFSGNAVWGQVEGLSVAISTEATITDGETPINLWQRNMFAVRVEATMGFAVADAGAFVRYVSGSS